MLVGAPGTVRDGGRTVNADMRAYDNEANVPMRLTLADRLERAEARVIELTEAIEEHEKRIFGLAERLNSHAQELGLTTENRR
jgi:hypothetical protein